MNAGTAVFMIVLVLVGSFAGLGYLLNQNNAHVEEIRAAEQAYDTALFQNAGLEAEINRLNDVVQDLQNLLTQCQTDGQTLQGNVDVCTSDKQALTQQLTSVTNERDQALANLGDCLETCVAPTDEQSPLPPTTDYSTPLTTQSGSGSNTITWLMLASVFVTMVTGWGVVLRTVRLSQADSNHRQPHSPEQLVSVKMTRQQLDEYLAWRRGKQ